MQQIDSLMHDYGGEVPGASVLVVRDRKVVFRKSYGLANIEDRIAATPDTNYRLASVTKQFTAAAILMLAERGKLTLDDPITRYLALPPYANAIIIRHLLSHMSGLLDYEDLIPAGSTRQLKDADVLDLLAKESTTYFAPGTHYRYSNTGYSFLALIVERASGQRFADFLRENIFKPAGMSNTVAFEEGVSTVSRRGFGYSRSDGGWHRTDQSLTSAVLGDGGIYTSIDDLVDWIGWLDSGRFDQALVPVTPTDNPAMRYGFGWRISEHQGHRLVSHTGETMGFRNALVRFPEEHLAVVVLTNRNEGTPQQIALKIADLYMAP
ncbi:MAG TPA: serine hydrolase domain-containing protein [Thermoanaerobaculia bacterium]|nr:serine hydrolase domain-containing protein [Thermoanaerobaculia bacterium]